MSNAYQDLISGESGLIHYYKMDEPSGTTCGDSKGSLDGTYAGTSGPTLAQAGIPAGGTSVKFNGTNGSNNSSTCVMATSTTGGSGVSVEAWVYLTATPSESKWVCGYFENPFDQILYLDSSRFPKYYCRDGSDHTITADGAISLNTWHHLLGVSPTSGTMKLYVDGVAQTSTISIGTPIVIATTRQFALGGGANFGFYDAQYQIDEVAIYNLALTATQALDHYNAGMLAPGTFRRAGIGGGLVGPRGSRAGHFI